MKFQACLSTNYSYQNGEKERFHPFALSLLISSVNRYPLIVNQKYCAAACKTAHKSPGRIALNILEIDTLAY